MHCEQVTTVSWLYVNSCLPLAEEEYLKERVFVVVCNHRYLLDLRSKALDQGESQGVN